MADLILRTDYFSRRPARHSKLEEAIEQMVREDLTPLVAKHWATKASALMAIDRVAIAQQRWQKEKLPKLIYKTFDHEGWERRQRLRRRARAARAHAERLLAR